MRVLGDVLQGHYITQETGNPLVSREPRQYWSTAAFPTLFDRLEISVTESPTRSLQHPRISAARSQDDAEAALQRETKFTDHESDRPRCDLVARLSICEIVSEIPANQIISGFHNPENLHGLSLRA